MIQIQTQSFTETFDTDSEDEALDMFAGTAGYSSYADLAETIGKTVDEAKADLTIVRI